MRDESPLLSLLHDARDKTTLAQLEKVLEAGSSVHEVAGSGLSPLMLACSYGCSAEVVAFILEQGADANVSSPNGFRALHFCRRPKTAQLLIDHGAELDAISSLRKHTALHQSIEAKCVDVVKLLVFRGASLRVKNRDNETPYTLALRNYCPKSITRVLTRDYSLFIAVCVATGSGAPFHLRIAPNSLFRLLSHDLTRAVLESARFTIS